MTTDQLVVLMNGVEIGFVQRDRTGRLNFSYLDDWRDFVGAIPLSLSMPLDVRVHGHAHIECFLWNVLPDNSDVLAQWGKRFHVSPRNPFALLSYTGEDCAGAVQFVRAERLDQLEQQNRLEADWLSEKDVADRLRRLRADPSAGRLQRDEGQFSLAGAQAKTSLLFHEGRWGVPIGRTPTTHILKPPLADLDGHAQNEHLCLALLRGLGLHAARSEVQHFEDEVAIVIERFDRLPGPDRHGQTILRLHQEDFCQALSRSPDAKYQSDGGPSPAEIVGLLRVNSSAPVADEETFVDALAFNWIIAGTDAHAKNYGLLLARGKQVRLAPLYDVASALPHDTFDQQRLKLAMKIGDKYRLRHIGAHEWSALARDLGWEPDRMRSRLRGMLAQLPDVVHEVFQRERSLEHELLPRFQKRLLERVVTLSADLEKVEKAGEPEAEPDNAAKEEHQGRALEQTTVRRRREKARER
jgi:serine/threonine-protein kinase HipA